MANLHGGALNFALVVVNYGSSALLIQNLTQVNVRAAGGVAVVVDNFTSEFERASVSYLADKYGWLFLPLATNQGFGGGMNAGAERAFELGASVIVALNPDATIRQPDLEGLVDAVLDDRALMLAPEIRTSSGKIWFDGMRLYLRSGRVASKRRITPPRGPSVPWITGACFAISREMWQLVGGFDADYFLYWEDVDLSHRVSQMGGRLVVDKNFVAVHDEGGTQRQSSNSPAKSELYYYYNIRNRLYFAAKHLDRLPALVWLLKTPAVSYEILLGGGRRQLLQSLDPWRAYVRGMYSGGKQLACCLGWSPKGGRAKSTT